MSMEPLEEVRVGIIGPSWWVNYWHLPAIQNHPQSEIHAICGTSERKPEEIAAKYGCQARFFTDYESMLDKVPLDGVIVCTPNDLHHPASMAALKRGLHVTCEKPIALNSGQAKEMAETAKSRGLIGMTNFPYRDNPAVQELRRRIADGYVGRVLHVYGQYHGGFGLTRPPGWRGSRERSGPGILGDLGSHLIDLARYSIGDEFASVCASSKTVLRNDQGINALVRTEDPQVGSRNDDSCAFLAEFAGGAQGIFHTSWIAYQGAYVQHQSLEVYGTEGRLHFVATHAGTMLEGMRLDTDRRMQVLPVEGIVLPQETADEEDWFRPGRRTATNSTYRWLEAIRTRQSDVSPNLEDGYRSQQVIDAVVKASRERCWVDVETD